MSIRPKAQSSKVQAISHLAGEHGQREPSRMPDVALSQWVSVAVLVACSVLAAGFAPTATATADRIAPARAENALVSSGFVPITPVRESLQQSARVKTWYSSYNPGYPWASTSSYVHFKTVDPDGYTVREALGSDNVDLDQETTYLVENPQRRALVDELRALMEADGWTELGVDGDWYEYVFTR